MSGVGFNSEIKNNAMTIERFVIDKVKFQAKVDAK